MFLSAHCGSPQSGIGPRRPWASADSIRSFTFAVLAAEDCRQRIRPGLGDHSVLLIGYATDADRPDHLPFVDDRHPAFEREGVSARRGGPLLVPVQATDAEKRRAPFRAPDPSEDPVHALDRWHTRITG